MLLLFYLIYALLNAEDF
ncbi:potassium-transporting ATPase subunit F [Xenorhabdus siamensis]